MDTNPTGSRTNRLFSTRKTKENSSVIKETLKALVVKFLGVKLKTFYIMFQSFFFLPQEALLSTINNYMLEVTAFFPKQFFCH